MQPPPKQQPCGCGAPSTLCVHGADMAVWMCKSCYERLIEIIRKRD